MRADCISNIALLAFLGTGIGVIRSFLSSLWLFPSKVIGIEIQGFPEILASSCVCVCVQCDDTDVAPPKGPLSSSRFDLFKVDVVVHVFVFSMLRLYPLTHPMTRPSQRKRAISPAEPLSRPSSFLSPAANQCIPFPPFPLLVFQEGEAIFYRSSALTLESTHDFSMRDAIPALEEFRGLLEAFPHVSTIVEERLTTVAQIAVFRPTSSPGGGVGPEQGGQVEGEEDGEGSSVRYATVLDASGDSGVLYVWRGGGWHGYAKQEGSKRVLQRGSGRVFWRAHALVRCEVVICPQSLCGHPFPVIPPLLGEER